jgi:acyl carrier protein
VESTRKSDTKPPTSGDTTSLVMAEIASLVADLHGGTARPVRPQSDLTTDLGLDSLSLVELGQRFDVILPEDTLSNATTVADWDRAVRRAQDAVNDHSSPRPSSPCCVTPPRRPTGETWPRTGGDNV